jgi:quinol monooxygenase YgiN
MKSLKVEYQLKSSKLEEILPVIKTFIKAAQADVKHVAHYSGYQYASDPTKFIHLIVFTNAQNEKFHQQAGYTKTFVEALYPNCQIQPVFQEIAEI